MFIAQICAQNVYKKHKKCTIINVVINRDTWTFKLRKECSICTMDVGGCHILKDEYLKLLALVHTICSGSSDPFYIVSYYIK